MSWEVMCRKMITLQTLRPHYSLPQVWATATSITTLLARFPIAVRTCTRSWPTHNLWQTLPRFSLTAVTAGVYLIINQGPPRSRNTSSALAHSLNTTSRSVAIQGRVLTFLEKDPLARAVSMRWRPKKDLFRWFPNCEKTRRTLWIPLSLRAVSKKKRTIWSVARKSLLT